MARCTTLVLSTETQQPLQLQLQLLLLQGLLPLARLLLILLARKQLKFLLRRLLVCALCCAMCANANRSSLIKRAEKEETS